MKQILNKMTHCLTLKSIHRKHVLRNLNLGIPFGYSSYTSSNIRLRIERHLSSCISRENFIPFEKIIEKRYLEARRSVVIEISKKDKISSLEPIFYKFGDIKNILEFKTKSLGRMIVLEFADENSLKGIFEMAQINSNGLHTKSIQIPFLKLNSAKFSKYKLTEFEFKSTSPLCVRVPEKDSFANLFKIMNSDCRNIEWVFPGVLSHLRVIPFGSSVNTFGHNNCDLDMIIDFSKMSSTEEEKNFPLTFQQNSARDEAEIMHRNLNFVADLLSFYMPGFCKINKIFRARVPIIKCKDLFTNLECDITVCNKSGYFMSEILYLYGCSDPRVRPLVFCIRLWAKEKRLSRKDQPGLWFSNFTMTVLVLFFLMNAPSGAVIPTLSVMENLSKEDPFTCEGIDYSYTREVSDLPLSPNTQTLEDLLCDFFLFYANFDYKNAISIITGKAYTKPMNTALYIQNPVERELNISKGVNKNHLKTFQEECVNAVSLLSSESNQKMKPNGLWGLCSLLYRDKVNSVNTAIGLDLKTIFEAQLSKNEFINENKILPLQRNEREEPQCPYAEEDI